MENMHLNVFIKQTFNQFCKTALKGLIMGVIAVIICCFVEKAPAFIEKANEIKHEWQTSRTDKVEEDVDKPETDQKNSSEAALSLTKEASNLISILLNIMLGLSTIMIAMGSVILAINILSGGYDCEQRASALRCIISGTIGTLISIIVRACLPVIL